MKKIIILVLMTLLCLGCLGCTKHPEGWEKADSLDTYITNYNDVEDILCEKFNVDSVTLKQRDDICSDVGTLENFGNGHYQCIVNNVAVTINCQDHIANYVYIDTLGGFETATAIQERETAYEEYLNACIQEETEGISGGSQV